MTVACVGACGLVGVPRCRCGDAVGREGVGFAREPVGQLGDRRGERVPLQRRLGRWRRHRDAPGLVGPGRRAPRTVVGRVLAQLHGGVERRGVVVRHRTVGGQHFDRRGSAGPLEGCAELVGEHVGTPRLVVHPDQHDRMRKRPRCGARGCEAAGEQHAAAGERPGRELEQGTRDRVVAAGSGEPVLGGLLRARLRERGGGPEVGACGVGRGHQRGTDRRRQYGSGGDETRREHLDGTGVLAEGDQLARPAQQVVVDPPGQCQQQVVRRPLRRPVLHLASSPSVGRSPHAPTSAVADRHSGLDPMMAA